jgi:hypothetical protein
VALRGSVEPQCLDRGVAARRWSNGGSEGLVTATSTNGGSAWTVNAATKSTKCTGGTAANGGFYERASDPWIAISPNGTAYLMSLSVDSNPGGFDTSPNAMLVMRSTDHGATWEDPVTLIRDESQNVLNDKNSITADPNESNFVYAVWDRLLSPPSGNTNQQAFENARAFGGDVYLARTTDGGKVVGAGQEDLQGRDHRPDNRQSGRCPSGQRGIQRSAARRVHAAPRRQERARYSRLQHRRHPF